LQELGERGAQPARRGEGGRLELLQDGVQLAEQRFEQRPSLETASSQSWSKEREPHERSPRRKIVQGNPTRGLPERKRERERERKRERE